MRRLAVWLCVHLGHWVWVPRRGDMFQRIAAHHRLLLRCPCGQWGGSLSLPLRIEHHPWESYLDRRTGAYLSPGEAARAEMLREIDDTP